VWVLSLDPINSGTTSVEADVEALALSSPERFVLISWESLARQFRMAHLFEQL